MLSRQQFKPYFSLGFLRRLRIATTGVASWPSVLADDEVLASAILDRLLHKATVLNIGGRSYRLKELDAQLQQQASTTSTRPPGRPLTAINGDHPESNQATPPQSRPRPETIQPT